MKPPQCVHIPVFALCLVLVACANTPHPPPAPALPAAVDAPYRVRVGDELAVKVYLVPELAEDVTVRPDGRISTTLAQDIPAAGTTPTEIEGALTVVYRHELRSPQVSVALRHAAPARIVVAGEVANPGEITADDGIAPTLLQALARAGGVRNTADHDAVIILRRSASDTPILYAADYAGAASGRHPQADVRLAPFDVVVVPKTGVARAYVWVNQHIQQFVPVSWGFSYDVNPANTSLHR